MAWMKVVACAALLLGAKVEESAQRFPDLLRAAIGVRYAGQSAQHEWALVSEKLHTESNVSVSKLCLAWLKPAMRNSKWS